jgi:2-polyprenyl-6-methoxyphenol hydroxylase-like FAD-dependent oxidoreductase
VDTDVLIVGAGPTGLMLANQLGRRGVRTTLIDRHAGPAVETRALGVQARTLEIYAKLGLARRALELGKRGTGADIWADGRRTARVPLGEAGRELTPFPFILISVRTTTSGSWARSFARGISPCNGIPSSGISTSRTTTCGRHSGTPTARRAR